jgi:Peptidase family M23
MRPRVLLTLAALAVGGLLTFLILAWLMVGSLVLLISLAATDSASAAEPQWAPPVPGAPTRLFHYGPHPFLAGQHRGVDLAAGTEPVRAACSGRVVFAGRVAGEGTVSQRCGRWRVSYAPLGRLAVRAGEVAGPGTRLGRASGALHFGVRREGRRFAYVDPLRFLGARHAPPPLVAPPAGMRRSGRFERDSARGLTARPHPPPRAVAPRPHPPPVLAPWPVWLGLGLGLTGLLGGGRLRLPYRRQEGATCRASSTSSSSPTIPSSR